MNGSSCGCATQPCGCCEGVQVLTPASEYNRPGLDALSYRVGIHGQFFETMQARLSTMTVEGVGADGQTVQSFRPLSGLSTRDPGDFSIALLDGWASVGDVLSFYQERIANEGYLRTATERRSVLELSRLVGYTLRPGVAATAYLAYTLDDNQVDPVTIAAGARSQSVPGPGEQPQYFETSDDLLAHREWNDLQVRMHRPQDITLDNALSLPNDTIQVAGSNTGLKAGDKLLLLFAADGSSAVVRTVASVDTQFADGSSAIGLQPVGANLLQCFHALQVFLKSVQAIYNDPTGQAAKAVTGAQALIRLVYLGAPTDPQTWVNDIGVAIAENLAYVTQPDVKAALGTLGDAITNPGPGSTGGPSITTPEQFVKPLLVGPVAQARNSLQLHRDLATAFLATAPAAKRTANDARIADSRVADSGSGSGGGGPLAATTATVDSYAPRYADTGTQLLVNFAPRLQDNYYQAWAGASLNDTPVPLLGLYALRSRSALFGASAARLPTYYGANDPSGIPAGTLKSQDQWADWTYWSDEAADNAFLDQANDAIAPDSYALVYGYGGARVMRIAQAATAPRSQYGLSAQSTQLLFDIPTGQPAWRQVSSTNYITAMRTVQVYAQSDVLTLVDAPIPDDVGGVDSNLQPVLTIQLDGLYSELTSGRWLILAGERHDVVNVDGVQAAELLMVSGTSHSFDSTLPGDTIHTTLHLATPTAYQYKRGTVTIYGNVVKATQGATCNEPLGSGDGSQSLQSFTLKQPPLTFVAAPTAAGAASTLQVYVNNVQWHETDSLAWLGPNDHGFITLTDDAGNTTLVFGDGAHGARLPTGMQNVNSIYRSGIGSGGNVKANQISMLQTRPLGVKAVINPLRASGGADAESRDLARDNAPLSVMALDRLVSVRDYADFTRRFAGIAKAVAQRTTDGRRELVYLTIAGVDDAPIDPSSDLYINLLAALVRLGDPDLPIQVDVRELQALALSAGIKLLPDYQWEPVAAAVRTMLLDQFGFDRRALGQPALRCELISAIQGVAGVAYVDIESFGAIPEKTTVTTTVTGGDSTASRMLLTQEQIAARVGVITGLARNTLLLRRPAAQWRLDGVATFGGGYDGQLLRPAELAIFTPAVPDTLILNQIP